MLTQEPRKNARCLGRNDLDTYRENSRTRLQAEQCPILNTNRDSRLGFDN